MFPFSTQCLVGRWLHALQDERVNTVREEPNLQLEFHQCCQHSRPTPDLSCKMSA